MCEQRRQQGESVPVCVRGFVKSCKAAEKQWRERRGEQRIAEGKKEEGGHAWSKRADVS